ncbi:MAG: ABC transporter permease [Lachnospiraceae bacterium]|nr:ABC transporter permease [Lachnospiraceae bacterium]
MRLLKVELKRILKTRLTLILLSAALLLSFVMAWLPITFSYNSYTDTAGNTVELKGLQSIAYEKQLQADTAGTVTPEKVRQALEDYQACLSKYGVENSYDLPDGVYGAEILPYAPLLHGIREAFANPDTGIAPGLMEIHPERLDDYYNVCAERIVSLMKQEQKNHPAAQQIGVDLYSQVKKPYLFFPGYSTDAMDYQFLLAFLVMLFCATIAAPVFTSDYQTGADDIFRCTKYGKAKFAMIKIAAAFLICGAAYCLCAAIYILVSNSLWGWECTKTSMQMMYSILNLPDMDIGQLQGFIAVSGLLSLLAVTSLTVFLSSRFRNIAACLSTALLFCILPVILYMALPEAVGIWIYSILPAGAVSLQTSILYAATDFNFWNIGPVAIWLPHVMLGAYVVEIPLFTGLAVYSYSKYTVK